MRDWVVFGAVSSVAGWVCWQAAASLGAAIAGGGVFGLMAVLVVRSAIILRSARGRERPVRLMQIVGPMPIAAMGLLVMGIGATKLVQGEPLAVDNIAMSAMGLPLFGVAWLMWAQMFSSDSKHEPTVRFDRVDPFDDDQR